MREDIQKKKKKRMACFLFSLKGLYTQGLDKKECFEMFETLLQGMVYSHFN